MRLERISRVGLFVALTVSVAVFGSPVVESATRQSVVIVGPGVTSCAEVLADIGQNADRELRYFAWAQGYMSGILMRAPPGKDEHLNLLPQQFPIAAQIIFLRKYCADHPYTNYEDAVVVLYRKLRTLSPGGLNQNK